MNYVLIGCRVFYREICYLAAKTKNRVDVVWLKQGLHDTPDLLNATLKEEVKKIEKRDQKPDAILLGYGLCSNGVVGLKAETIPIVVPKTDDCIGIFLGSQKRYLKYFNEYPGTYWYNTGWIENAFTPSKESLAKKKRELVEQYGEENGEYIFEITNNYTDKYHHAIFISSPVCDFDEHKDYAKRAAADLGWQYHEADGDISTLQKMIDGDFDERFLVLEPGHRIEQTGDDEKIKPVYADSVEMR